MSWRSIAIGTIRLSKVFQYEAGDAEFSDKFFPRVKIFDGPGLAV
jgi:hypothetical protein